MINFRNSVTEGTVIGHMVVTGALESAGWGIQKKSHVFRDGMVHATILWGGRALGPYERTCLGSD